MQSIILKKGERKLWNKKKTKLESKAGSHCSSCASCSPGVLKNAEGPLAAFDFSNLVGAWGKIGDAGQNFIGKGGAGAREGMMQALSLIPAISFAVAIIDVVTQLGAIDAGVKLFTPLLRPLLGLPGDCGVAFVSTFTSSDVGSSYEQRPVQQKAS